MNNINIRLNIIKDFKVGFTTKELMDKYGFSKTTINDWLRPTRLEIENDSLNELRKKSHLFLKSLKK